MFSIDRHCKSHSHKSRQVLEAVIKATNQRRISMSAWRRKDGCSRIKLAFGPAQCMALGITTSGPLRFAVESSVCPMALLSRAPKPACGVLLEDDSDTDKFCSHNLPLKFS